MKRRSHLVHGWLNEAFPDEPVYSEALHAPEDVLYSGSDDEACNSPTERRKRYEEKGQRFLQDKPLFLLSASLRGPFTKESGWKNPWRSQPGRRRNAGAIQSTPTRVEESIVIAATPTILESALRGRQQESFVGEEEASSRSSTPTPHRYLDDETLYAIKTWQNGVANQPSLDDPFDESYEPSSLDTTKSLEVEITPRTHGSRSFIVSSSAVGREDDEEDSVEHTSEDIADQDEEVNLGFNEEKEAEVINVDEDDDSSLTDLDEEQIEELGIEKEAEEHEEEDDSEVKDGVIRQEDSENEQDAENQQISANLPVRPPSDYDSPTKHPATSQPLPQPHGKLDLQPREELEFLPADTIDLSPAAVKVFQDSLRGNTCYSPSWRAQERKKQGNLLPGLVDAAPQGDNAARSPSSWSVRSMHAPAFISTSHDKGRTNENESVTLEQQTVEPDHMLVDNQLSDPEETKDSPNQPSDVTVHHQQITVAQPECSQRITSTTDLPQSEAAVTHTALEPTDGEKQSHTTEPTSTSSAELSSPATSLEEEEDEPIEEPVGHVRKLLWPKSRRQASTQESIPDMALDIASAAASYAQAGLEASQNGSVPASAEHDEGQGSLEYFTTNQPPRNEAAYNTLDSQSPSRFLQSQPHPAPEATVSEESNYDDTINQVRFEWPAEASSLPRQSQVQTQNSLAVESVEGPSETDHDTLAQHISPGKAKRISDVMDLRHITNPASRNTSPLRPSGVQKSPAKPMEVPVQVQTRPSATPEAPANLSPIWSQLSVMASQALAQVVQPVIQQSPWAKGDSQITALAPAPEPRVFNPGSSPLSSPGSSSRFVDVDDPVLPVASSPPVTGSNPQAEEEVAALAQAETPQAEPPHPPSTPETKRSSLPTPEFTMSIKSFKHFITPSPKRPAKRPRLSLGDGRLPDTQALEEAVITNPWDSSRLEIGGIPEPAMPSVPRRKIKRVSWAPLPGEADYVDLDMSGYMDVDVEDPDEPSPVNGTKNHRPRSILSTSALTSYHRGISRRAASPPPSFSMPSVDSLPKESQKFGKHFAAVSGRRRLAPRPPTAAPAAGFRNGGMESPMLRDVSGNARSTGTSRLAAKRLLPSEPQQTCGSPAVDGMAEAFVRADRQVENLRLDHHQQIPQTDTSITGKGIWQDPESPTISASVQQQQANNADTLRLPTLPGFDSQPPPEETDEVTEVMDNLDDFIDSWDIDEELAEARGEKTKRKSAQPLRLGLGIGSTRSSGLDSGGTLWDSSASRPQSVMKRKRTVAGDEEEAQDGMVESQESREGRNGRGGGGGEVYDPGVWDRIV